MRWFRKRRRKQPRPRPLQPGELIDGSTPEGRARAYEIFGHLPKMRDSPPPAPNPDGFSLSQLVIEMRGPDY